MPGSGGAREPLPATALAPAGAGGPPAAEPGVAQRGNTLLVIAGVGVLLLAMGVGVLIGRSGTSKQSAGPAQVISVAQAPSSTSGAAAGAPVSQASFVSDWPAGTGGYTVQLQMLPVAGTALSAVEAAKAAAGAKGAKSVGALKSEEFASLSPGSYVIYSGVAHKKGEAEKTLASLKKSFPGAKVLRVASSAGAGSPAASSGSSSSTGAGSSESKPAPPTVLETLKNTKGKNYEEKSKALPNVVSTG